MRTRRWHSPLYSSTSAAAATRSACAGRAIRASAVRLRRMRAASPASSPCTPRPINTIASPNSSCNTRMIAGRWRHGSPRPPFWMTSPSPLTARPSNASSRRMTICVSAAKRCRVMSTTRKCCCSLPSMARMTMMGCRRRRRARRATKRQRRVRREEVAAL